MTNTNEVLAGAALKIVELSRERDGLRESLRVMTSELEFATQMVRDWVKLSGRLEADLDIANQARREAGVMVSALKSDAETEREAFKHQIRMLEVEKDGLNVLLKKAGY